MGDAHHPSHFPFLSRLAGWPSSDYTEGMSRPAPGSLEAVKAEEPGLARYRAAVEYLERLAERGQDARDLRDIELRRLCLEYGPTEVARMTGASLGTVKAANIRANDRDEETIMGKPKRRRSGGAR